jgi:hypothetical protein
MTPSSWVVLGCSWRAEILICSNFSRLYLWSLRRTWTHQYRTCLQCCMVHRVCSMVHSKRDWRCWCVKGIRMQGLLDHNLPSWSLLRTVCVETRKPRIISKVFSKRSTCPYTMCLNDQNRSWAGVVTLCWPPACLLAGAPCSWYPSQALVMTVWSPPSAAPTWRKVAPCCTIPSALNNSAPLKCHLILALASKWQMKEM